MKNVKIKSVIKKIMLDYGLWLFFYLSLRSASLMADFVTERL